MLRALLLTHRLPFAPNRGDRIRAYHILRHLQPIARVDLVSLVHDAEEITHVDETRALCASVAVVPVPRLANLVRSAAVLTTARPLTHVLLNGPSIDQVLRHQVETGPPDVILAYGSGMARFALSAPLAGFPLVVDMVDVDSFKWKSLGATTRPPLRWIYRREAATLAAFEARLARAAFATTLVNAKERDSLLELAPDARVEVMPCGVDVEYLRPPGDAPASGDVVFCGVMNYPPNEQGAVWLARKIWPLVRHRVPDARLRLVGSEPTRQVRNLADPQMGIEVTGRVPDVRPYLWNGAVAAAPLLTARGIQTKVLEAVAAGLPCVITPTVAAGLPSEILPGCQIAGDSEVYAERLVTLLRTAPSVRRALAQQADVSALAWGRQLAPLGELLHEAAGR
jgi:sugar transferase (PEP-CTERM/EpsH1 system associated)